MTLLYLALSYLLGILVGHWLWRTGFLACDLPAWLWLPPFLGLPFALWWERRALSTHTLSMRWPVSAGFVPPKPALSVALLVMLALALTAGFLRYAGHPFQPCLTPEDLAYYNTKLPNDATQVTISGYVNSYPLQEGTYQTLLLQAQAIRWGNDNRAVDDLLRLRLGTAPRLLYGQPVQVTGVLQQPPIFADFDYKAWLAGQNVHSVMNWPQLDLLPGSLQGNPLLRAIYGIRMRGEKLLQQLMPEPYAALANGMLMGIESGIPDEVYEAFNLTGVSHTIVISGSNVALVSGIILAAAARLLGRRRALWPTLTGIVFYTMLVGGDPSVTRAAVMGGLFVTAAAIGRQSTALVSLGVACLAMTLYNPLTLWDVGFQLSAAATAGLILFSPAFTAALDRLWPGLGQGGHLTGNLAASGQKLVRGLLTDGLLMTLAATLTTMPLMLFHFNRISLVSLVTNLLIVPVQPFILLWGSVGLLIGLAGILWLAKFVLWIPYLGLVWTVAIVRWTASWPGGSLTFSNYGSGAFIVTYLALALFLGRKQLRRWAAAMTTWAASRPHGFDVGRLLAHRSLANTVLALCAVATILLWWVVLTQPDGRLHVHFLDVGQGDGIFIQTPSGRQVLIDGGRDPQVLFNELGKAMPFWDRSLDLLLLTHPDQDHMAAQLDVPERYRVNMAVVSVVTMDDGDGQSWEDAMATGEIPISIQSAGGWLDLGDGVALWILWPPAETALTQTTIAADDKNERSLVAMLVYGELRLLLTGDAGLPSEQALLADKAPLAAQILKVGHHGSDSSTGPNFVDAVNPAIAVIGVGTENRYGHPTQTVLDRLSGRAVLRTDLNGSIHLWSDGHQLWIETERGQPSWYNMNE